MKPITILLIEDEAGLASFIQTELELEGYQVLWGQDGRAGLTLFQEQKGQIRLILLDWMLPVYDGLTVARRIRKQSQVPIIMLTTRDQTSDIVAALDAGLDDYLAKPFDIEELFARIRVILRRQEQSHDQTQLHYLDLTLDLAKHEVFQAGQLIQLTPKEFGILYELLKEPETVHTRDQLLDKAWGPDYFGQTNTIDVYIRALRNKLGSAGKWIQTIRGVGYILKGS